MQETVQNVMNEKDLQMLKELRLMDDDFFSEALDGKIEAVEYILNTILERDDIKVKSTNPQRLRWNIKVQQNVPSFWISRQKTQMERSWI